LSANAKLNEALVENWLNEKAGLATGLFGIISYHPVD